MSIERVGEFSLGWGESLVWDDRAQRLYFVDCAARTLHWLDGGRGRLHTLELASMPAGIVPTEDGRLVAALDDGLQVVDTDASTTTLLTSYPAGLGGRANDACADLSGNLITGTLNLEPAEGSLWWYEYDAEHGRVGPRRVFGDVSDLAGLPDGATVDTEGGLWCELIGGSQLARFTTDGLDRTLALPLANPADVAFGGTELDRLFVVSVRTGDGGGLDGALLAVDGLGARGRPEPRFRLP